MLISLAVSLALVGVNRPSQDPAPKLVSKMLKYYSGAQTMTGTITFTASDGQGKAQLVTTVQYEKPSRLYIRQVKSTGSSMQWFVVSDGKTFSYPAPENTPGQQPGGRGFVGQQLGPRALQLFENVYQPVPNEYAKDSKGRTVAKMANLTVEDIYAIGAPNIGDRSVPLDIAIGRLEDLKHDNLQWMTVQSLGQATVNGQQVTMVGGGWRPYGNASSDTQFPPGRYTMAITEDGKLVQYTIDQLVGVQGGGTVNLRQSWDVDLTPNGKVDPDLFKFSR